MRKLHVATDGDIQFYFNEADVRDACRIMRCGEHVDECISLMRVRAMECALCSSVLNALKRSCARKQTHSLSEAV